MEDAQNYSEYVPLLKLFVRCLQLFRVTVWKFLDTQPKPTEAAARKKKEKKEFAIDFLTGESPDPKKV